MKVQVDTKTKDQRLPKHSKYSKTTQHNDTYATKQGGCTSKYVPHYSVHWFGVKSVYESFLLHMLYELCLGLGVFV